MVKFIAQGTEGLIIGLGITKENIARLRAGQPMSIDLADLHLPPGRILIFYGDTEQAIARTLLPYLGEDTIIHGTETL